MSRKRVLRPSEVQAAQNAREATEERKRHELELLKPFLEAGWAWCSGRGGKGISFSTLLRAAFCKECRQWVPASHYWDRNHREVVAMRRHLRKEVRA